MEELKTAPGAMKKAEEALAKQGFILRWKYKVDPWNEQAGAEAERNLVDAIAEPCAWCQRKAKEMV